MLGADTAVVVDGEVLGKPAGRDDAVAMLAVHFFSRGFHSSLFPVLKGVLEKFQDNRAMILLLFGRPAAQ